MEEISWNFLFLQLLTWCTACGFLGGFLRFPFRRWLARVNRKRCIWRNRLGSLPRRKQKERGKKKEEDKNKNEKLKETTSLSFTSFRSSFQFSLFFFFFSSFFPFPLPLPLGPPFALALSVALLPLALPFSYCSCFGSLLSTSSCFSSCCCSYSLLLFLLLLFALPLPPFTFDAAIMSSSFIMGRATIQSWISATRSNAYICCCQFRIVTKTFSKKKKKKT